MATAARRSRDVIIMFPPSFVEQTTDVARDKGPAWRFCGFAGRPPNFRTHEDPRFFPLSRTPPFTPPSIHYDGSDHETIGSAGSKEKTTSFLLTALISRAIEKRKNLVEDCSFRTILKQTLLEGDEFNEFLEKFHEETNDSLTTISVKSCDTREISRVHRFVIDVCFDT